MCFLEWWPFIGFLVPDVSSPALIALGLAVSSRILTVLRDGFGWRLCVIGCVYEPFVYARDRRSFEALRTALIDQSKSAQTLQQGASQFHPVSGSRIHGLSMQGSDAWALEDTILSGASLGRHWLGQRLDEYLQATPEFCAMRWRMVVARQWIGSVSPQTWLAMPSFGHHLIAGQSGRTVFAIEKEPAAVQQLLQVVPRVEYFDAELHELGERRFEAIVMIGMAEHMGDRELRRILTHVRSSLTAGGHLILMTLCSPPRTQWATACIGGALRFRSIEQMRNHLENCGFRILEHEADPHKSQLGILCTAMEKTA